MRVNLLMLIATIGLVALAASAATSAATPVASASTDSSESAVWADRKLLHFSPPVYNGSTNNSCDQIIDRLKFVLVRLGARASDMQVDARPCNVVPGLGVDVSFAVLVPTDRTGRNAAGGSTEARWQQVRLEALDSSQDCAYLQYVTRKILPLFSTKDVKLIPKAVCGRYSVGLRAQILMPAQPLADVR